MGGLGVLAGLIAKILADNSLRFLALKTVLSTLFILVLPVVINNIIYRLLEIAFSLVLDIDVPSIQTSFSFSGLAGWFVAVLRLPEAVSVVLSAVSYRIAINSIPFLK